MTFEDWWDEQKFPIGTRQSDAMFAKRWARAAWERATEAAAPVAVDETAPGGTAQHKP